MNTDVHSATYPYERVINTVWMKHLDALPKMLLDYIMDMPLPGYTPPDDNTYPRCRLMKYLYYDGPHPLDNPLPSPADKIKLVYNSESPDVAPTGKGYRLYPVSYIPQAQTRGQTILKVFIGNVKPLNQNIVQIGMVFDILSNMQMDTNTKTLAQSRCVAIEQCLWECLSGVNIDGVGTLYIDRQQLSETGSENIMDSAQNIGRRVIFGLTYGDSATPPHSQII